MDITELRARIDKLDNQLIELLEARFDVAAEISAWKAERGIPVLDERREAEKLRGVRGRCRPETADLMADLFVSVLTASKRYQARLLHDRHTQGEEERHGG